MNWIAKALTQKALSCLPGGEWINYTLQTRIFRDLPVTEERLLFKASLAAEHWRRALRCGLPAGTSKLRLYEFGAGWDLILPLFYYSAGVEAQTLVDARPLAHAELVNITLKRYAARRAEIERNCGIALRDIDPAPVRNAQDLQKRFGIRYAAPADAARTGLPSDSIDLITNNSVLEHIPRAALPAILAECRRILKPGGLMSCLIDPRDHSSYHDKRITPYNFLKFSPAAWGALCSRMQYQNRLRRSDYRSLFEEAGLEIALWEWKGPTEEEQAILRSLPLAAEFRTYTIEDLGARGIRAALRKPQ